MVGQPAKGPLASQNGKMLSWSVATSGSLLEFINLGPWILKRDALGYKQQLYRIMGHLGGYLNKHTSSTPNIDNAVPKDPKEWMETKGHKMALVANTDPRLLVVAAHINPYPLNIIGILLLTCMNWYVPFASPVISTVTLPCTFWPMFWQALGKLTWLAQGLKE